MTLGRKRELEPSSCESVKHLRREDMSLSDLTSNLGAFYKNGIQIDVGHRNVFKRKSFSFGKLIAGTSGDVTDTVTHPWWSMKAYLG